MKSKKNRDLERRVLVHLYEKRRRFLKCQLSCASLSREDEVKFLRKLRKLPRDSSHTRVRNRCIVTGRGRSVYRSFKVSRIELRRKGGHAMVPGLRKASW